MSDSARTVFLAARRYFLQHELRLRWGDRPRVIVRNEGGLWAAVLDERWLPTSTERTLVLGAPPETAIAGQRLPLEWRVYREWGPDHRQVHPPVALIVCKTGRVRCIEFEQAMRDLATGDDAKLEEQLAELARLSHRP